MKNHSKILALSLLLGSINPVWAHTGLHHTHSLISGFIHPWSGIDHLLAMFAVGLYAAGFKARATVSILFSLLLFIALGTEMTRLGIALPTYEQVIILSLFFVGALLIVKIQLSRIISFPLIACFALCHGYAHAIEMESGENGRLYLSGILLSTALLSCLGMLSSKLSTKKLNAVRMLTGLASTAVGTLALAF